MRFQPISTRFGHVALAVAVVTALAALALFDILLQQDAPSTMFLLLVGCLLALGVSLTAAYWAIIALRLDYQLNRNGLTIRWGLGQQLIPFTIVKDIVPGESVSEPAKFRGINLDGLHIGIGDLNDYGLLKFRATAPLEKSLLIVTPKQAYVISPDQPRAFIQAWEARKKLGATQEWQEETRRSWPFNLVLSIDPLTWWLIGIAAFCCLSLLGFISFNYAAIPASLPVHFDNLGQADRIAEKSTLFTLPVVGAIVWGVNTVVGIVIYHREKLAAYLLWGSAIVMQLCLWVAALTIVP